MEQRRNAIVELVNREGSLSFVQLKEAFPSVSEMTLRTDLKALDQARSGGGGAANDAQETPAASESAANAAGPWTCSACGGANKGRFCEYCGSPRP